MAEREMRAVYAETLVRLANDNKDIVILEADLMKASGTKPFRDAYPDRAFNIGVAEANMVGVAAGLSTTGKIPFAASFTSFASRRAFDQFFISVNYARLNVKLVGTDPGVAAAFNGGTHMCFEDVGLMRTIPDLIVFEPSDPVSLEKLIPQAAEHYGSTYMRLHRKPIEEIYTQDDKFELGKGHLVQDGTDITIIATGAVLVPQAIEAARRLADEGISAAIIDMHTFKPIDKEIILEYAEKTGRILTCENHQINGGLGSAVAEVLVENRPTPMQRLGIMGEFGEVGTLDYLVERFGLDAGNIVTQAQALLKRGAVGAGR